MEDFVHPQFFSFVNWSRCLCICSVWMTLIVTMNQFFIREIIKSGAAERNVWMSIVPFLGCASLRLVASWCRLTVITTDGSQISIRINYCRSFYWISWLLRHHRRQLKMLQPRHACPLVADSRKAFSKKLLKAELCREQKNSATRDKAADCASLDSLPVPYPRFKLM